MLKKRKVTAKKPEENQGVEFIQTIFNCPVIKCNDGFAAVKNYYNGQEPSVIKGSTVKELLKELAKRDN